MRKRNANDGSRNTRRTHRDRRGARNAASAAKGGRQAQESCGDTTRVTSIGRRGRLVLFNDSSEYETTRTLAHTSLALAPTMVYITK